jgi:hypothetical protein
MKGLDTIEALEFELKVIHEYEKYNEKLKKIQSESLPTTDSDYSKVELLHRCLPILLKQKEHKLKEDKLYNHIKKIDSKHGIRHKTNMKQY